MNLYTIGFTQKSAEQFFKLIQKNHIQMLLDIRLNNKSQLAGFSKGRDLKYFLAELCHCDYRHYTALAPTSEIMNDYKKKQISWDVFGPVRRIQPLADRPLTEPPLSRLASVKKL